MVLTLKKECQVIVGFQRGLDGLEGSFLVGDLTAALEKRRRRAG